MELLRNKLLLMEIRSLGEHKMYLLVDPKQNNSMQNEKRFLNSSNTE